MIVAARIFFVGGVTSFRALFYWLTPWIYIPTMFVAPLFQILLFAYIGRSARSSSARRPGSRSSSAARCRSC